MIYKISKECILYICAYVVYTLSEFKNLFMKEMKFVCDLPICQYIPLIYKVINFEENIIDYYAWHVMLLFLIR